MTVIIKRSNQQELRRVIEQLVKQNDAAEEQNKHLMRENKTLRRELREVHDAITAISGPLRDYRDQKRLGMWYRRQEARRAE